SILIFFIVGISIKNTKLDIENTTEKIKESIHEHNYTEAINNYELNLSKIPKYKYNILFNDIMKMSKQIERIPGGEKHIMNTLLAMETYKLISKVHRFDIYNYLGRLYLVDENYAKASEYILDTLILAKDMDYKFSEANQLINLGVLFSQIQGYETSIKTVKEALSVEIKDKKQAETVKMCAYANLSEIYLRMGDYENCKKYTYNVLKNEKFLNDKKNIDVKILITTIESNLYLHKGENEKAKKYIDKVEKLLKSNNSKSLRYTKELFIFTKAKYYESISNYNEAINIYNSILSLEHYKQNKASNKKQVLENLVDLCNKTKQYKLEDSYMNELLLAIKNDEDIRYRDYSNYIVEQAEEKYTVQHERESIKFLILIILIGTIVIIFMYRANKKRVSKMKYIAMHDKLTGVYNRGYFDNKYEHLIKNKYEFSILMIDIDDFKIINDTFGHQFGDVVLKEITSRIKSLINDSCTICRYGGEEFVIINEYKFKEESVLTAELIRSAVEHISWSEDINVSVSIGVAYNNESSMDTLEKADVNLYKAKRSGKNKIVV
ncbi:MAG: diguanylate cyclase, partial [Paraclostridium sp.]|uniref:diguanylate cyclase n=1 Tax=Paraclostridium sp. TaxID=2023273 RepID=UPI003F3D8767